MLTINQKYKLDLWGIKVTDEKGQNVHLSMTEMKILNILYLAWTEKREYVTRKELANSVFDYIGSIRTVDVHIRRIREKMPDIPLETVWGTGYKLSLSNQVSKKQIDRTITKIQAAA